MFTTKELMYLGVIGTITFVLAFTLGSAINLATGIPLTGAVANGVIVALVLTVGIKGVDKFWAGTIIAAVFSTIAIFTPTFGPPGIYKLPVGIIAGLFWDSTIAVIGRGRRVAYIIAAGVAAIVIVLGIFEASVFLGLPGATALRAYLPVVIIVNMVTGIIGAYLGLELYEKRLRRLDFFNRVLKE